MHLLQVVSRVIFVEVKDYNENYGKMIILNN